MWWRRLSHISLAWKCRLLFSLAVLLIITAALSVPRQRMDNLLDAENIRRAEQILLTAFFRANLQSPDWLTEERHLREAWPTYARATDLPNIPPRLIPADPHTGKNIWIRDKFIKESMQEFHENRNLKFTRLVQTDKDGRKVYRAAMAVRQEEGEGNPGALRGVITVSMPIKDPGQLFLNHGVILGAILSAGFLAVLVFYLIVDRLILMPVRDLRRVAEQVSTGDMEVRSTIATGDEYEELALAFNKMLTNLKVSQDELRTINKSLDIRLGELAESNVSLFEANKLKSEFLANVSHELRTPLASIIGFAELLRDASESPESGDRLKRYSVNILSSGRMLLDMINDLLDVAKIEAGRMELHRTEFSIVDVCNNLIDFTRPLAEKKLLNMDLTIGPDIPAMNSDAGKIQQILYNLLSNAIKFTPEQGRVALSAEAIDASTIKVTVSDTGPGIAQEKLGSIFEKFWQVDSSATREHSGTGLGLAISKDLTEMLGGTISVESQKGRGATFTVTFPAQCPDDVTRPLISLT